MNIQSLQMTQFRNYTDQGIRLHEGINLFLGENAQGKTNVLEAIYLCCMGHSHRTQREREMIQWESEGLRVKLAAQRRSGEIHIEIRLPMHMQRQIRINEHPITRKVELIGQLPCIFFSPEDLQLIKGPPQLRRRYMDIELAQLRPTYLYALGRYTRALKQRAVLLKQRKLETLSEWEDQLAQYGAQLIRMRSQFIQAIMPIVAELHGQISGMQETITLSYSGALEHTDVQALKRAIEEARASDMMRGFTSVGPHRDDLKVLLNGQDVRVFGSQGQQRTAALALKLAEVRWMRKELHESPILLLDDVFSELDEKRQHHLLEVVQGAQTIVTGTHMDKSFPFQGAKRFWVQSGRVVSE